MNNLLKSSTHLKVFFLISCLATLGCGKKLSDELKAQEDIKGHSSLETTNEDLRVKALAIEKELAVRQRYYQGVKGAYEGSFIDHFAGIDLPFKIRITITPSISPYQSDRQRTPDELLTDVNNLSFTAQVALWDTNTNNTYTCSFTGVKADLVSGEIKLLSPSDCAEGFSISLADSTITSASDLQAVTNISTIITKQVLQSDSNQIKQLFIEMNLARSAQSITIVMNRIKK